MVRRVGAARSHDDRGFHERFRSPLVDRRRLKHRGLHRCFPRSRRHGHLDPVQRCRSVQALPRRPWTPWNVDDSWFRPFDDRFTDVRPDSQVWVRRNAYSPWVLDVPFTPDTDGRWTNKRDRTHTEALDDVTWFAPDGLRYARPEVTLMFKAAQVRRKDQQDAEATLPRLDDRARWWLRERVAHVDPDHPWVRTLSG